MIDLNRYIAAIWRVFVCMTVSVVIKISYE